MMMILRIFANMTAIWFLFASSYALAMQHELNLGRLVTLRIYTSDRPLLESIKHCFHNRCIPRNICVAGLICPVPNFRGLRTMDHAGDATEESEH